MDISALKVGSDAGFLILGLKFIHYEASEIGKTAIIAPDCTLSKKSTIFRAHR